MWKTSSAVRRSSRRSSARTVGAAARSCPSTGGGAWAKTEHHPEVPRAQARRGLRCRPAGAGEAQRSASCSGWRPTPSRPRSSLTSRRMDGGRRCSRSRARGRGREARPRAGRVSVDGGVLARAARGPAGPLGSEMAGSGRVMLILCGSFVGFMEREVLGQEGPLVRASHRADPPQALRLPGGGRSSIRRISIVGPREDVFVCGGVPLYLKAVLGLPVGRDEHRRRACSTSTRPLHQEAEFLLREELRDVSNYHAILLALAERPMSLTEVGVAVGLGHNVQYHLQQLVQLGYVARRFPLIAGGRRSTRSVTSWRIRSSASGSASSAPINRACASPQARRCRSVIRLCWTPISVAASSGSAARRCPGSTSARA